MIKKLVIGLVALSGSAALASPAHVVSSDPTVQKVIRGVAVSQIFSEDPVYCDFANEIDLETKPMSNGATLASIEVKCGTGQDERNNLANIKVILSAEIANSNVAIKFVKLAN